MFLLNFAAKVQHSRLLRKFQDFKIVKFYKMKKYLLLILMLASFQFQGLAQSDTLTELIFDPSLTLQFPVQHKVEQDDFRQILEGRSNGIIYSLYVSDEYAYKRIANNLELDSLYELIMFNTLQIYGGDAIQPNSYTYKFGELRGKYLSVESNNPSNPYAAEYYMVCVSRRLYLMSVTYLKNISESQIAQAKNFVNTIHFDPKLNWINQWNKY